MKREGTPKPVVPAFGLLLALALAMSACSSLPKQKPGVYTVQNEAAGYAQSGNTYFAQANYAMAERFFRMALDADFSIDYEPGIVEAYDSLAKVYLAVGDVQAARSAYAGAISYARRIGDPAIIAHAGLVAAEIDLSTQAYRQAAKTIEGTIAPLEAAHDPLLASAYHDMGSAYKGLGEYPKALEYLQKALALHTKANELALAASDYYMIASVYSKQGDDATAFARAEEALRLDKQMENQPGIGSDLRALGIIAERQDKQEVAYDYYYSALQVFRTTNNPAYVKDLLERLVALARALGRTKEAADYAAAIEKLQGTPQ